MIVQAGKAALLLALVALPVWVVMRLVLHASNRTEKRHLSMARELLLASFLLYLTTVAAITLAPLPISRSQLPRSVDVNVIPALHSVRCFTHDAGAPERLTFCLENLLGNVALFLPLGLLLPLVTARVNGFPKILAVALCGSVAIEVAQLLSSRIGVFRTVDIDDVLLNVVGACLGYGVLARIRSRSAENGRHVDEPRVRR